METTFAAEIKRARTAQAEQDKAWTAQQEARRVASRARSEQAKHWQKTLVNASPGHYAMWLEGAVKRGVQITHVYPYELPDEFYLATRDIEVTPLFGSNSVSIISPAGIKVALKDRGHNQIYHIDGFTHTGFVPLYSDIG